MHNSTLRPLPRSFYDRDPRTVARDLLGKLLVRGARGRISLIGRIVELEAYLGLKDPAAHSFHGMTLRNAVLFGPPGHAYVYFIYGNHYCLNVSCQPPGVAGGVLFRALEPIQGEVQMAKNRSIELLREPDHHNLTNGPGKLSEAFGITRARDNNCDLTSSKSDLWIAGNDEPVGKIRRTPRIGIRHAVEHPYRFLIAGNPFVSGPKMQR